MDWTVILGVAAVVQISALVRATFGFGDAVVAMPLLTLIIGIKSATPLVALLALTNATLIIAESWRMADFRAAVRLILGAALGIPLGMYGLKYAPEMLVKGVLGGVLIGFGLFNLVSPSLPVIRNQRWAYLFGWLGGVLGGAYNTNGPPVVIYGLLQRWNPRSFRATMQGFLLPANILIVTGHGLSGFWTLQTAQLYVISAPLVLIAAWVGGRINKRFDPQKFLRILYLLLIALGAMMFF